MIKWEEPRFMKRDWSYDGWFIHGERCYLSKDGTADRDCSNGWFETEDKARFAILKYYTDNREKDETSRNNGGETDYYKMKNTWKSFQDVIEDREMNYAQGNILKVACTFNVGRHDGTNYERDLNKIIYFANRELNRLKGANYE